MKPIVSNLYDIYPDAHVPAMQERYAKAEEAFKDYFGSLGEHRFFSAPGRTEICGNHTDHQHGHVLATSINICSKR